MRITHFIDTLIISADAALRTLVPPAKRIATRDSPANEWAESHFSSADKKHAAGLMRVNHAGEVCAQGLYQGQALTAQLPHLKIQMKQSAEEELDHLAWCEQRLNDLNSKPSILNPFWYAGSLLLGVLAGWAGDKVSLGFVVETESQVSEHLYRHLQKLSSEDKKTRAVLERMHEEEQHHATIAMAAGAIELPNLIKKLMSNVSKLMTFSSYYI